MGGADDGAQILIFINSNGLLKYWSGEQVNASLCPPDMLCTGILSHCFWITYAGRLIYPLCPNASHHGQSWRMSTCDTFAQRQKITCFQGKETESKLISNYDLTILTSVWVAEDGANSHLKAGLVVETNMRSPLMPETGWAELKVPALRSSDPNWVESKVWLFQTELLTGGDFCQIRLNWHRWCTGMAKSVE